MAVIVSAAQAISAFHQTSLQELQTKILDAQAVPQMVVRVQRIRDPKTNAPLSTNIIVENRGGMVREFSAIVAPTVMALVNNGAVAQTGAIPVSGYFSETNVTQDGAGELLFLRGANNTQRETQLAHDINVLLNRDGGSALVASKTVLQLDYRDVLGRPHTEYYEVSLEGVKRKEASAVKDELESAKNAVDFEAVTPDALLKVAARNPLK
jgi:hypothetical protein